MPHGREGNRRSGVALSVRQTEMSRTATRSDRNGNDAVAGAALEAFARWLYYRFPPSNCYRQWHIFPPRDNLFDSLHVFSFLHLHLYRCFIVKNIFKKSRGKTIRLPSIAVGRKHIDGSAIWRMLLKRRRCCPVDATFDMVFPINVL